MRPSSLATLLLPRGLSRASMEAGMDALPTAPRKVLRACLWWPVVGKVFCSCLWWLVVGFVGVWWLFGFCIGLW